MRQLKLLRVGHEKGWFGSLFQQDLADLEPMLKYLDLDAKQVMVSGVTACLGGVGSVF